MGRFTPKIRPSVWQSPTAETYFVVTESGREPHESGASKFYLHTLWAVRPFCNLGDAMRAIINQGQKSLYKDSLCCRLNIIINRKENILTREAVDLGS